MLTDYYITITITDNQTGRIVWSFDIPVLTSILFVIAAAMMLRPGGN